VGALPKLEYSDIGCEIVVRHTATVALAGVDVNISICVFSGSLDDVLTVDYVVLLQLVVGSKAIRIDGRRLLLATASRNWTVDSFAAFAK